VILRTKPEEKLVSSCQRTGRVVVPAVRWYTAPGDKRVVVDDEVR
jgi:hypothetical protein